MSPSYYKFLVFYRPISGHTTPAFLIMGFLLVAMVPSYSTAQNEDRKSDGFSFDPKLGLNPSMAIIFVCLLSAFFIMGCVSVSIRHCSLHHHPSGHVFREDPLPRLEPDHRGLDSSIIDGFPICRYSDVKELRLGKCVLECAVCLNELTDEETLRLIPSCSHVFHPDCIDAWLASHVTCPVCRANLDRKSPVPAQETDNLGNHVHIGSPELIGSTAPVLVRTSSLRFHDDKILRSHSTGHVPVHDCERFTLRLPEDVRARLIKSELSRARSCVAFTRVRSSTKGFRRNNNGEGNRSANAIIRGLSNCDHTRSEEIGEFSPELIEGRSGGKSASLRNLLWPTRSFRAPLERLFSETRRREEYEEERSFRKLMLHDCPV